VVLFQLHAKDLLFRSRIPSAVSFFCSFSFLLHSPQAFERWCSRSNLVSRLEPRNRSSLARIRATTRSESFPGEIVGSPILSTRQWKFSCQLDSPRLSAVTCSYGSVRFSRITPASWVESGVWMVHLTVEGYGRSFSNLQVQDCPGVTVPAPFVARIEASKSRFVNDTYLE